MLAVSFRSSFVVFALAVALPGPAAWAQQKGDSMEAIERALGQPAVAMNRGGNVIWSYADGRKVTFHGGIVVDVSAPLAPEKRTPSAQDAAEAEERMPVRALAAMPVQKPDDAALLSKRAADLAPHPVGAIEWALRLIAITVCVMTWTLRRPVRAAQVS